MEDLSTSYHSTQPYKFYIIYAHGIAQKVD